MGAKMTSSLSSSTDSGSKALDDLRSLCNDRISTLTADNASLLGKVTILENGIYKLDNESKAKIDRIIATSASELDNLKSANEGLKRELSNFKVQLSQLSQLQSLVEDFQFIEKSLKHETTKMQDRVKILTSDIDRLNNAVSTSRAREAILENSLASAGLLNGEVSTSSGANIASVVIQQNQKRMEEYEAESQTLNASMNDMLLEIEAASSGDSKLRQDFAKILLQLKDSQKEATDAMGEILRLKDEMVDLKKANSEAEVKRNSFEAIFKRQEGIINQLRGLEQACRVELNETKALYSSVSDKLCKSEFASAEAQKRLNDVEIELKQNKERCSHLQERCIDLANKYNAERKQRLTLQREPKKKDKSGDGSSGGESSLSSSSGKGGQADVEMLDLTLGMLRCSVCRERFKEVCINRCFHLFCRQCIDNSLKSRQRKCPACGEKFGQDDVKTIYFTN
jgi:E3 ubiquitin-protein ligase BRE1